MSDQPRRFRGTRIGIPARVAPGWSEYRDGGAIERHPREVHYDILRREGFDADRARQIAAQSSEIQQVELERQRDGGVTRAGVVAEREQRLGSGWDIRTILPSAITGSSDG